MKERYTDAENYFVKQYYSNKVDEFDAKRLYDLQAIFVDITHKIINIIPEESAHRTCAMRKLLEAKMTLSVAITHSEKY